MAEVDSDTGLLLLEVSCGLWGVGKGALVDIFARLRDGGFGEGHDLLVGGRRGVVAHGEQAGAMRATAPATEAEGVGWAADAVGVVEMMMLLLLMWGLLNRTTVMMEWGG